MQTRMRNPSHSGRFVRTLGFVEGTMSAAMAERLGVALADLQPVLDGTAPMTPRERSRPPRHGGPPRPHPRADPGSALSARGVAVRWYGAMGICSWGSRCIKRYAQGDQSRYDAQLGPKIDDLILQLHDGATPAVLTQDGWWIHRLTGNPKGAYAVVIAGGSSSASRTATPTM